MSNEVCLAFVVGFVLGFIIAAWNNRQPRLRIVESFRDANGSFGMTTYEGSPEDVAASRKEEL